MEQVCIGYQSLLKTYWCGSFCFRVTDDGLHTRAHLESQLAASLALKSPMTSILHPVSGKVSYVGTQLCLLNWPTKYANIFVRWKLVGDKLLAHLYYFILFYFIFLVYMQRSRRISDGHAWICIIYGTQKSIVDPDVLLSLSFPHHVHTRPILFLDNHGGSWTVNRWHSSSHVLQFVK